MRRPTRSRFHYSDLGGPFVAFAPEFRECDQHVRRGPVSNELFDPTRHRRSSILSRLIDALRHRSRHPAAAPPVVVPAKRG
jgi:hypothetical protein